MSDLRLIEIPAYGGDPIGPKIELSAINGKAAQSPYTGEDYWQFEVDDVALPIDSIIEPASSANLNTERFKLEGGANARADMWGRPLVFQNLIFESRLTIEDWQFQSIIDHAVTVGCFNQKVTGGNNGPNDRGFRFQATNNGSNVRCRWYPSEDHNFHQSYDHNMVSHRTDSKRLIFRFFPDIGDGSGALAIARGAPENVHTVSRTTDVVGADPTNDIDENNPVWWNIRSVASSATPKYVAFSKLTVENFSRWNSS